METYKLSRTGEQIDNLLDKINAVTGLYLCTYNVTTRAEIAQALENGLLPYVIIKHLNGQRLYRLSNIYSDNYIFTALFDGYNDNGRCVVNKNGVWSNTSQGGISGSASTGLLDGRSNATWGVSCANYDEAVRKALCDADGQSTAKNRPYTEIEKEGARHKIGAQKDLTLISGYDATKTQILKHINGEFIWVDE